MISRTSNRAPHIGLYIQYFFYVASSSRCPICVQTCQIFQSDGSRKGARNFPQYAVGDERNQITIYVYQFVQDKIINNNYERTLYQLEAISFYSVLVVVLLLRKYYIFIN